MFEERVKKLEAFDISLIKAGVLAFTLFLVTAWPAFREVVIGVHWGWFLGAAILVLLRPCHRFWFK